MQKVSINKTGINISFWDDQSEKWIEKSLADSNLPITWFMNYAVEIEMGMTVREILDQLKPHAEALKFYFVQNLGGVELEEIFMIADQAKIIKQEIAAKEVFLLKIADLKKINQNDQAIDFLSIYPVLMGLEIVNEEDPESDVLHPLSQINFENWCDLPILADDWLEIVDSQDSSVKFECVINWTFSEIISTILSQAAITLQITQAVSKNSTVQPVQAGPVEISHVWDWLHDLDTIFLNK
jgi:hypothetical protein